MTLNIKPTGHFYKPFLAQLSISANVRDACAAAGVSRQAAYQARDKDEMFRQAWDEAVQDAVDSLKQIAWERARESSDRLLEFLLRHHVPEYKEATEINIEQKTLNVNMESNAPRDLKASIRILIANGVLKPEEIMPDGYTVLPPVQLGTLELGAAQTNGHHAEG